MMRIQPGLTPAALLPKVERMFELSAVKIRAIEQSWSPAAGSPVCTVNGRYASRGWTEWTQGFQFGSAILQFDATGDREFLEIGRERTVALMAPHVTHIGVHDHGFNNVSTYGNLLRLMNEGRIEENPWERRFYELALKSSGAVQAARWSRIADGGGYVYSFNGPHSLFVDTIRSVRALVIAHQLGHALMGENDKRISLLDRAEAHIRATAKYSVYYGEGRDAYDVRGRTAHEAVFNSNDGNYRCPNSQQGYSPFSTWTRGLAWAMCGFAEQLEFFDNPELAAVMEKAARATCDFFIENTRPDGVPFWDTASEDPIDSSAAAIGAQGLLRLGRRLKEQRYVDAGLTVASTLFDEPYLSVDPGHQGLILHSVYHRPNGWNWEPGESSMWGDYHARELGLYLLRLAAGGPYLKYWL
jgi:unsaturated chondroitin disaccharide hydrolase